MPDGDRRRRRWYPTDADYRLVWEHLARQSGLPADRVRLSDGRVVPVGADAEDGEL